MRISKKIKAINNKTKQNRAQYDLSRQTTKIFALSSGNVGKYDFLTCKYISTDKNVLEKTAAKKKFEYLLLNKELKAQTDISIKQYQKLENMFEFDKLIKNKKNNI